MTLFYEDVNIHIFIIYIKIISFFLLNIEIMILL